MLSENDYKDLIKHLGYEGQEYRLYFSSGGKERKKLDISTRYILEHRQHFINYNFKNHPAKMDIQHKKIHEMIYLLDPWDLLDKNSHNLRNINSQTRKEYYYSSMADHIFFQIIKDNTEENFRVFAGNVGRLLILLEMCYLRPQNIVTNLTSSYYNSRFALLTIQISGITEEFEDDCFSRAVSSFPCLYCGQPLIRDCSNDYSNSVVYDYLYFCKKKCMENLLDRESITEYFDTYWLEQLKKRSCKANLRKEATRIIEALKKLTSKVSESSNVEKSPHKPSPIHSVISEIINSNHDFLESLKKLSQERLCRSGMPESIYLEKKEFYECLKGYLGKDLKFTWPKFVLRSLQILKLLNEKVNSRDDLRSHYIKSDNSKIRFEFYYQN
jgi:hypothetical protein